MNMNNIVMLKNFMKSGGNPQKFVQSMVNSNPIIGNLSKMASEGNNKGVEAFARNMFKEQGRDFDKEFSQFKEMFK